MNGRKECTALYDMGIGVLGSHHTSLSRTSLYRILHSLSPILDLINPMIIRTIDTLAKFISYHSILSFLLEHNISTKLAGRMIVLSFFFFHSILILGALPVYPDIYGVLKVNMKIVI